MDQRPVPPPPLLSPAVLAWLRRPQFLLPLAVVAAMTVIAFGVQPGGASGATPVPPHTATIPAATTTVAFTATASATPQRPLASPSVQTQSAQIALTQGQPSATAPGQSSVQPTSDVAGVRATPTDGPTQGADLSRQANQCGSIQETSIPLAIEQGINGVSVKATRVTTYPIEYFRCMLMATGTQDAFSLASSVGKAETAGMTHTVLIDLWITYAGKDFAQLTLKDSQLAAAGQVFNPLATLGGRADVVVSSGQGRTVTLVVAIKNTVGDTAGPLTLTIGAPMFGGQPGAGKFSLFLPTP